MIQSVRPDRMGGKNRRGGGGVLGWGGWGFGWGFFGVFSLGVWGVLFALGLRGGEASKKRSGAAQIRFWEEGKRGETKKATEQT